YKRGSILDANGSVLDSSDNVYHVVLDAVAVSQKEEYLEPTLNALKNEFGIDVSGVRSYIAENGETSRYHVLVRRLSYNEISHFIELQNEENSNIAGVWFEEEYKRVYPGNTLACDVIGFTTSDNQGKYGLEEYYNDVLSGIPGREYGYLNDDSELERRTIAAEDGNTIITTLDANIQSIVEKYLKKFNDEYTDRYHKGNGAENVGCIIMRVNTGEILAMASYPNFDLNDTRNTDALLGMPLLDKDGKKTGEYVTEEALATLETEDLLYTHLNALWKNFCISDTYEPGSVAKPFTVAAAIECGSITGNESYNCNGKLFVGDRDIPCHNTYGDGPITVQEGIERSCNVVMMHIGQKMGRANFAKFQHIFNFGLKTNVDLQGEARTVGLIYSENTLGPVELATNTFGQGFNATMIQMITGFCSMINGGYYYEPHLVSKIVSPSGATIQNIEPRVLKQTVSAETSQRIIEYCNTVVTGEHGTGKTARPAGYMIGGKTGTAETLPRKNGEYVVSFMGYAPADDPEIAIYVVVDRPNVPQQDDAKYATRIVKNILTEVLPYMGIFMTEELSETEEEELRALQIEIMTPVTTQEEENPDTEEGEGEGEEGGEGDGEEGEGEGDTQEPYTEIWKTFPIDPETGYAVDPNTGDYVDPVTGAVIGVSYGDVLTGTSGSGNENGDE
ncbi:MAG: cell division protein FtsI, partial [Lachnospiraceae bacterium]|nr:cell division protein FtsI [Lachnospiraceae bacterium]